MAGMTEMVGQARERQELVVAATNEIQAARKEILGVRDNIRQAAQEIDTLEFTLRQSYEKLDKAINSETQRRTAWQTLLDCLGTACFAVMLKRPRFSWTRIKGESNVQGGGGNGSVEGRGTGRGIGTDGGSPEGDWSPCRRGGGGGGFPGAGAAVERQPEARRGAAAAAWRIAGGAVP